MSRRHVIERFFQRISKEEQTRVVTVLNSLTERLQNGQLNGVTSWYRTVTDKITGEVICHITGQNNYISTILAADMEPRGKKV